MGAEELQNALTGVVKYGYYYTPIITGNIHKQVERKMLSAKTPDLTDRERELLRCLCTDLSYAEIAKKMILSESTVDTYRARLFDKFEVRNRVGLILKAFNFGLVKL
jgi:DNA-binding CsgD family transcriptional regulator